MSVPQQYQLDRMNTNQYAEGIERTLSESLLPRPSAPEEPPPPAYSYTEITEFEGTTANQSAINIINRAPDIDHDHNYSDNSSNHSNDALQLHAQSDTTSGERKLQLKFGAVSQRDSAGSQMMLHRSRELRLQPAIPQLLLRKIQTKFNALSCWTDMKKQKIYDQLQARKLTVEDGEKIIAQLDEILTQIKNIGSDQFEMNSHHHDIIKVIPAEPDAQSDNMNVERKRALHFGTGPKKTRIQQIDRVVGSVKNNNGYFGYFKKGIRRTKNCTPVTARGREILNRQ